MLNWINLFIFLCLFFIMKNISHMKYILHILLIMILIITKLKRNTFKTSIYQSTPTSTRKIKTRHVSTIPNSDRSNTSTSPAEQSTDCPVIRHNLPQEVLCGFYVDAITFRPEIINKSIRPLNRTRRCIFQRPRSPESSRA